MDLAVFLGCFLCLFVDRIGLLCFDLDVSYRRGGSAPHPRGPFDQWGGTDSQRVRTHWTGVSGQAGWRIGLPHAGMTDVFLSVDLATTVPTESTHKAAKHVEG